MSTVSPLWMQYARVLIARKPALAREGTVVARQEAHLPGFRIDAEHLRRYRVICGASSLESLPIAYPHVLASALHLSLLSAPAFPVGLLGLVHIRNVIRQRRRLASEEAASLRVWLEGYRDTPRGQEFDLHTEWHVGNDIPWNEVSTFLARRRGAGAKDVREPKPVPNPRVELRSFRAAAGLGREYGWLAGDLNPIHVSDLSARMFGFRAAIAHGMWSLARCASEFPDEFLQRSCEYSVHFKLPIFLRSWVLLESWPGDAGLEFTLRDAQGDKPHLSGSLRPLE